MTDNPPADDEEQVDEHLQNVEDGCGCTEIWEHLSETRESDATSD